MMKNTADTLMKNTAAPPTLQTGMVITDYPALFAGADTTSRGGQAWYTGFVRADLILVVLAAAVSAIAGMNNVVQAPAANVLRGMSVALLILALLARTTNRIRRPEQEWWNGRAVAESTKSAAWKYMMRGQPYTGPESDADTHFATDLRSLLQDRTSLPYASVVLSHGGEQITAGMRAVRGMPWLPPRPMTARRSHWEALPPPG